MVSILLYIIILTLMLASLEMIGQVYAQKFFIGVKTGGTNFYPYLVVPVASYFCISYILSISYYFEEIGTMNNLWSAISIICFTIFGYYLGETVSTRNIIGISITLIGICVLLYDSYTKDFSKKN